MAKSGPAGDLPSRFRAHVRAKELFRPHTSVIIGLSARSDSVALLHLLAGMTGELDLHLSVAHVQHGEKELASADAAFAHDLAAELHLPVRLHLDAHPDPNPQVRRAARVRALAEARAQTGAAAIATAETLEDVTESFFATLVRDGTASPDLLRETDDGIVRPLLPFSHEECSTFLREHGYAFQKDPEALNLVTIRDRFRLLVLPLLRHVHPSALENLAASSHLAADDAVFLEEVASIAQSDVQWTETEDTVSLDYARWTSLPSALRRRLLNRAARRVARGASLSPPALVDLEDRCRSLADNTSETVGRLTAHRSRGTLIIRNVQ